MYSSRVNCDSQVFNTYCTVTNTSTELVYKNFAGAKRTSESRLPSEFITGGNSEHREAVLNSGESFWTKENHKTIFESMPTIHKLGCGLHNHLMIHVRKNVIKEEILVGIIIDFRMMNTLGCQLKIRITPRIITRNTL